MKKAKGPIYIQWYSVKDQDARRPSGVRWNISLWHIESKGTVSRSLCGRPVGIQRFGPLKARPVCKRCQAMWERLNK